MSIFDEAPPQNVETIASWVVEDEAVWDQYVARRLGEVKTSLRLVGGVLLGALVIAATLGYVKHEDNEWLTAVGIIGSVVAMIGAVLLGSFVKERSKLPGKLDDPVLVSLTAEGIFMLAGWAIRWDAAAPPLGHEWAGDLALVTVARRGPGSPHVCAVPVPPAAREAFEEAMRGLIARLGG